MATPPATPPPPAPQPLGLPRGSVRATLALILSATFWYQSLRGDAIDPLLLDAVLLVVAFYFGVRSTTPIPPAQPPPATWQPLFLPRGIVRTVLFLGFMGVIAYTFYRQGGIESNLLLIGQVLTSYAAGYLIATVTARRYQRASGPSVAYAMFRHVVAVGALGITGVVCWSLLFGAPALPPISKNLLAWVVAFYFGSRVAP